MGGGVVAVYGIVLVLLIVPEFAAIAVVVATIAVLVVAVAALVGLVAFAAAALASPYLLVRRVRRRLRSTKNAIGSTRRAGSGADRPADRLRVLGRAHVTAFAPDEPDEAGAILEVATPDAAEAACVRPGR
jgi:membrane protein implicated in regulation of membrane protease activity